MIVQELLEVDTLKLRVRAYERGLDRPIRWVHTTELIDPSLYLQGGELILTTGVWRKRPNDDRRFVSSLVRANACGLVYGLPKPNARMPAGLVAECERNALPLLEASYELPFVRISKAFVASLTDERQEALLRAIRRNEQFVELAAGGGGSAAILRVLARDRLASWLLGPSGRLLETGSKPAADDLARAWEQIAEANGLPLELALPVSGAAAAFSVVAAGHVTGYLVVRKALGTLSHDERTSIDQALAFLGLESMRQHAERALSARFARELLDLVTLGEARPSEIASRLRAFGVDAASTLTALVALIADGDQRLHDRAAELMEWFFAEHDTVAVTPAAADEVVAILNVPGRRTDLRTLADELAQMLARELAPRRISVGVGAPVDGPAKLRRSLIEARHAARLGTLGLASPAVSTSDEIGSHAYLLALQEEDLLRMFHSAILGPVVEYDARRGTQLLHTLDVFLASTGHWQETAAALNVHVNTLRYRLARIEALTGRSLSAMENRVDFYLALRSQRNGSKP